MLAVLGGMACTTPALAHKVVVFASVRGKTIEGEVYFYGGAAATGASVTVVGPNDQVLAETTTDDEGEFTCPVRFRCDHKVIADVGEGHRAEYTVAADELPDDLPPPPDAGRPADEPSGEAGAPTPVERHEEAPPEASRGAPVAAPDQEQEHLKAEIEAVAKQVAALRRDLDKYHNELRLQDILGGLGYILGVMGLAFYFLGVRRKESKERRSAGTSCPDSPDASRPRTA